MIFLNGKLPFFRKKQKRTVYSYEFVDVHDYEGTDEKHTGIQILDGPFRDLLYFYRRVQFIEDKENDQCNVKFEWVPIRNPPDVETQTLYDALGDILVDVFTKYPLKCDTIGLDPEKPAVEKDEI